MRPSCATMKWGLRMNSVLRPEASIALSVAVALALYRPVLAQDAAQANGNQEALEEVMVTGSRIARQDYVAQSPIVTAPMSSVEESGLPTVDAYLLQLPQFQPGTGGFSNVSSGGLGVGQSTLNLRG